MTADLLPGLIKREKSIPVSDHNSNNDQSDGMKASLIFALVIVLGICENLSGIGNMIAMEREWVPTLAATTTRSVPSYEPKTAKEEEEESKKSYTLTHLNAVTRRIDLLCKLFAPVFISVIILSTSMFVGVLVVGCTSTVSWGIEMWCAKRVWRTNAVLRRPKVFKVLADDVDSKWSWRQSIPNAFSRQISQLRAFFATDIWIPALSLTMLHFSVLAYAATFITFLLNAGFSLFLITSARVASSIVEVSSTFVAPLSIKYLAAAAAGAAVEPRPGGYFRLPFISDENKGDSTMEGEEERYDEQHSFLMVVNQQDEQQEPGNSRNKDRAHLVGLARSGLWGINLQLACLVSKSLLYPTRRSISKDDSPTHYFIYIDPSRPRHRTNQPRFFVFIYTFPPDNHPHVLIPMSLPPRTLGF